MILLPKKYKMGCTGKVVKETSDSDKTLYEVGARQVRDFAFILSDKFHVDSDKYNEVNINTYNLNEELAKDANTYIANNLMEIFSELFGKYPYHISF